MQILPVTLTAFYRFHPVGQGLFCSGTLSVTPSAADPFRWVYDCGSVTSKALVTTEINRLKGGADGPLDLLVLSHFDRDHISGVIELLTEIGAKTLLLPWAPLWHRMLMAIQLGIGTSEEIFQFFVDPVVYLSAMAGDGLGDVIFVLPADGEGPTEPGEADPGSFDPDGGLRISFDKEDPNADHPDEWFIYAMKTEHQVRFLKRNSAITVMSLWEFVPYNDPTTGPPNPESFANKVNELRPILLSTDLTDMADAFEALRVLYFATFRSSKKRNNLSLFVYAGTIGQWDAETNVTPSSRWHRLFQLYPPALPRASIFYSGDGDLRRPIDWSRIQHTLGLQRLGSISILQVPHHGAESNWHIGLAAAIDPQFSIISSDPDRGQTYHPHPEVLRDLWKNFPVQVDQSNEFVTAHVCHRGT